TELSQGGQLTTCFHVQHFHRLHIFPTANNIHTHLEINSKRKTTVFSIDWREGTQLPLLASPYTSSFPITRPPRQQLRGVKSRPISSYSTHDQEDGVWNVDSSTPFSIFNHG
ncbi:unnamed protein product, partial [Hymenolepis diminuta]